MTYKITYAISKTLIQSDIVPLLNIIAHKAYNNQHRNCGAMACRGWNPPNRYLLDSPEIKKFNELEEDGGFIASLAQLDPLSLNVSSGKAADVMDTIIQHQMINGGIEERQKKLREGMDIRTNLAAARSMTSGVLAANGIYNLDNPEFLDYVRNKKQQAAIEECKQKRKLRSDMIGRISSIKSIGEKKGNGEGNGFKKWNIKEMHAYLQYKKVETDKAMPATAAPTRARLLTVMHRASPICSPHASDDEESPPTINHQPPVFLPHMNPLYLLGTAAAADHGWSGTNEIDGVVVKARI